MHISIITICFNNPEEVKKTCASVDMQALKPYEHWIIDGSTNSDVKQWLDTTTQPAYRKWINERDKGIADAFSKGIQKATGDILYLLNSGDTIYDETVLQKINETFQKDSSLMWCNGKLNTLRGGIWVAIGKPFEKSKLYRGMRSIAHPTMYVRKEVYEKHGLFNPDLKMAMDYDFLCRIADEKNIFIDYPLATFDPTGVSSTKYLDAMKEARAVYQKYYGKSIKQNLWGLRLTLLYYLLNSKFGRWLFKQKVKMGKENW
jgi:glycosyltransferase involved in cell wall biosynthesis